jgi:hypothetical protein
VASQEQMLDRQHVFEPGGQIQKQKFRIRALALSVTASVVSSRFRFSAWEWASCLWTAFGILCRLLVDAALTGVEGSLARAEAGDSQQVFEAGCHIQKQKFRISGWPGTETRLHA